MIKLSESGAAPMEARTAVNKSAIHVVFGGLAAGLLTFLCYLTHIDLASAIPLYLLLVVGTSLMGDWVSSAIVATLSAGCLDFFFTAPLFSVRITNPLNALALIAFVFTALVITRLVTRVQEEASSAKVQKERLDRLYQLSQQLLSLEPEAGIGETFLAPFHHLFGVTAVCVFDADTAESHFTGDSQHELVSRTREAFIRRHDVDDAGANVSVRCLRVGGNIMGTIGFEGLRDSRETVGSLTALTTALVERTKAFRRANAAAAAEKTEAFRSAVLDALAHEFKTPLATMLAAAGGLREAGPLVAEQLEMADTVENEAVRLGNLTTRLIRTARLDSAEIRPRLELIEVSSLVAHIANQYAARSSDRQIVLPQRGEPVEVMADPELLRLAVTQLIENACKYSQPASTIVIGIEAAGGFVSVRVSNNGSSIAPGERHRIFERFYRGEEAKHHTSGSGLGLYIARKIVVAHGGALDLETGSRAGDGVAFCLKIPAAKDEADYAAVSE